jgi:hypothetical protein
MMDLAERYLQEVGFWLPKNQKDDIVAELASDIQAQIEERQAALGRRLSEEELGTILRERGRPVLVANRFLPREHLIGPVLFPIYRFVLKIVALCYLVPWLAVWFSLVAFGVARLESFWGFWSAAFFSLGTVTAIFAVLERSAAWSRWLENWDPRSLPPLRNVNRIPRSESVIELVVNLVFLAWWVANMSSRVVLDRPDIRVTLDASWPWFFRAFLALGAVNAAFAALNLLRPFWTVPRAALRLLSNAAGSALFCFLMHAGILEGLALANLPPSRAIQIVNAVNLWAARALPLVVVVGVAVATFDAFRIFRVKGSRRPAMREAAVL